MSEGRLPPMPTASDEERLPPLFVAVDTAAIVGQRRYASASAARLILTVAAAVFAAFASNVSVGDIAVLGLCAALAFLGALAVEIWMLVVRPERDWYDGRGIAESLKTVAWRYMVGGAPFETEHSDAADDLRASLASLEQAADDVVGSGRSAAATPAMAALRDAPFEDRRSVYVSDRVEVQRAWYVQRAATSERRAAVIRVAMLVGEALGVAFALGEAFGYLDIGLSGIASTAIGAGAAWLAVRQHEATARSYASAGAQLMGISERLRTVSEEEWALEVAMAEDVITREHAAWHVARTDRVLP